MDIRALEQNLLQVSGYETRLDFDLLAAGCRNDISGDLCLYSPFLSAQEKQAATCCTMLLLMTTNRINQACCLPSMCEKCCACLRSSSLSLAITARPRKEIQSQSDNLAAVWPIVVTTKACRTGDIRDRPRFLLFEYATVSCSESLRST